MRFFLLLFLFFAGCSKPVFNDWLAEHMKTCKKCRKYPEDSLTYDLCPEAWEMSHPRNSIYSGTLYTLDLIQGGTCKN